MFISVWFQNMCPLTISSGKCGCVCACAVCSVHLLSKHEGKTHQLVFFGLQSHPTIKWTKLETCARVKASFIQCCMIGCKIPPAFQKNIRFLQAWVAGCFRYQEPGNRHPQPSLTMLLNIGRGPSANDMKKDSNESFGQHKVQDNILCSFSSMLSVVPPH